MEKVQAGHFIVRANGEYLVEGINDRLDHGMGFLFVEGEPEGTCTIFVDERVEAETINLAEVSTARLTGIFPHVVLRFANLPTNCRLHVRLA